MSPKNNQCVNREIPEWILDDIYISLNDAYERVGYGSMGIKRCINYLESEHGYEPPSGYLRYEEVSGGLKKVTE